MLPQAEAPMYTEGYEGFYHLDTISGDVEKCVMSYIIRDHDRKKFEARKERFTAIGKYLNEKYGEGTVTCEIRDQYRNMAEIIAQHPETVEIANRAIRRTGLEPVSNPVRGGTDGAQLSYRGLPCPNLGTGGYAYHGLYEHAVAEEMDLCVRILLNIVEECAAG